MKRKISDSIKSKRGSLPLGLSTSDNVRSDAAAAAFKLIILFFFARATIPPVFAGPAENLPGQWLNHGRDLTNNRWAKGENQIRTSSVSQLSERWSFTTYQNVTATPSIADRIVYFPDWSGSLFAVKQITGSLIWEMNLTEVLTAHGLTPTFLETYFLSRSTPTIAGDFLLVGIFGPCAVVAVDRFTGAFRWSKILDPHPWACVTMSGTAFEGYLYIGSSSVEEVAPICCSFQGAFFKLEIETGEIIWRVLMLPDNKGRTDQYAGNALWGSSPPVDVIRRTVYIATGNNYQAPEEIVQCELQYRNKTNPPIPDPCLESDNHVESVLAINIDTGHVVWARHLGGYDTYILTCVIPIEGNPNCPPIPGSDYDFGEEPILLTIPSNKAFQFKRDIVVVGQKSGIVWALDRDTGEIVWNTQAGPGGHIGGSTWGITTDGMRVFTNIINNEGHSFTLVPGTTVINTSAWVALNATTGQILWSTANPSAGWNNAALTCANGVLFGAANGLLFEGKPPTPSALVAMDAETGEILKFEITNGSAHGGPSVVDGCAFQPLGITPTDATSAPFSNLSFPPGHAVVCLCVPSAM